MNHDTTAMLICVLALGILGLIVGFRNLSLRDQVQRQGDRLDAIRDHLKSPWLESQIFTAICEHNQDPAIDYGDRKEMADLIAKAVRAQINQH
jgi:hypothetical protein